MFGLSRNKSTSFKKLFGKNEFWPLTLSKCYTDARRQVYTLLLYWSRAFVVISFCTRKHAITILFYYETLVAVRKRTAKKTRRCTIIHMPLQSVINRWRKTLFTIVTRSLLWVYTMSLNMYNRKQFKLYFH